MVYVTYARGEDIDGLYVDGKLVASRHQIDIDDILIAIGRQSHVLKKVYIDDEWVHKIAGYILPYDEKDLVIADV